MEVRDPELIIEVADEYGISLPEAKEVVDATLIHRDAKEAPADEGRGWIVFTHRVG